MPDSAYRHAHPITILNNLSKVLYLLIIPFLRGMLLTLKGEGFAAWVEGAWFDILVVLMIAGISAIRWRLLLYRFDSTGLYLKQGLLVRRDCFISIDNISTMSMERAFFLKPFRAVAIRADTNGGSRRKFDFEIVAYKNDALAAIEARRQNYSSRQNLTKVFKPHSLYIAALSAFLSNSFAGVLFASAFISRAGTVLGEKLEGRIIGMLTQFSGTAVKGVPPIAAVVAIVILAGWFIGFIQNLIRLTHFKITRTKKALTVESGILTNRTYSMLIDKINYLDIRQSLMTKLLRIYLVFIHCTGYGKGKNEVSSLIPSAARKSLVATLTLLLPEIRPHTRVLKPKKNVLFRYISGPFWLLIALPAAAWIAAHLFPAWRDVTGFFALMLCIPVLWLFLLKVVDFASAGVSCEGGTLTLRHSKGFILHTIVVPNEKVALITLRQSPFQKHSGLCDIMVYTYTEGSQSFGSRHRVMGLVHRQVEDLLCL